MLAAVAVVIGLILTLGLSRLKVPLGAAFLVGATGIVVGPIVAALFVSVWEIYGDTFAAALPGELPAGAEGEA